MAVDANTPTGVELAAAQVAGSGAVGAHTAAVNARLSVDLDALARNYALLRAASGAADCAAVVKANAYGLGVVPVTERLDAEGCRHFFVATLAEGLELREIVPRAAIHVFEGPLTGALEPFIDARLVPVLNSLEQIEWWAPTGRPAVLHVDTGMTRLGMSPAEVDALSRRRELLDDLVVDTVMTHLACADEPEHPLNREQLARFDVLRARLPAARTSVGNSAGALLGGAHAGDMIRPGIGLYGGNPFAARPSPVEPVATLLARIVQVQCVDSAQTVGYGATYDAGPGARIATVAFGYADGYPRCLGNRGTAHVAGRAVPVVGRVSMDLIGLDVSALPRGVARPGDYVELFGPNVPLEDVARAAETLNYELLVRLGRRVHREYVAVERPRST